MSGRAVRIAGLGHAVGRRIITNDDLAKIVDTSDEWIRTMTGIRERRFIGEGESTSTMAAQAGHEALCASGVRPEEIDLVLVATSTPDYMLFPCTACLVQDALGLANAGAQDLSAACSGFVYGLVTASQFIAAGSYERILVIGADSLSPFVDFTDRATCVLFGDGAGAAVLVADEGSDGLLSFVLGADGSGGPHLNVPAGGSRRPLTPELAATHENTIHMNGREVYRFSTTVPVAALEAAATKAGVAIADLDLIIAHQANIRILQTAAHNLGVPDERFFTNLDRYGNTSAATIPLALYDAQAQGRLHRHDLVGFMGFGAGLTWATAIWRW